MAFTAISKHPVKIRDTGYVYFPKEYIQRYDLSTKEFEWAEDTETHTLALMIVDHGKRINCSNNLILPLRIAKGYIGSYHLEKEGEMLIFRPVK